MISGGGSKGAFAVGAVRQLLQTWPGLHFDILVGTSTGSLIVPFIALDEAELAEQLYTTQTTRDILVNYNLGDRLNDVSVFGATPLWNLITHNLNEDRCKALLESDRTVAFTTVSLQTGALVVFSNKQAPSAAHYEKRMLLSPLHLQKAVMASASQPVFMPPVKVNKNIPGATDTEHQYVDGGVRQYAGIEMAIDAGATEIFTILLSTDRHEPANKEFTNLFSILQQTIDIFTDDVGKNDLIIPHQYNEALLYLEAVKNKMRREGISTDDIERYFYIRGRENPYEGKAPLKLFTIRPGAPLGGGPGGLVFDPSEMKQMLAKGKQAAGNFIASLSAGDISWA